MATDPVCEMEIEETDAAATAEYDGQTYYFCAAGCKETFVSAPEEYV